MSNLSIGRLTGIAGMSLAIAGIAIVTSALISEKAITPKLRQQALCSAGYVDLAGDACLSEKIAELRTQSEAELKAAIEARNLAEHALIGRMVFEEGPTIGSLTVIVGTTYRDHTARSGFVRAICWGTHDRTGLDPRITLAQMGANGVPVAVAVDLFEQDALGVDRQDIEAARTACPWPQVRS